MLLCVYTLEICRADMECCHILKDINQLIKKLRERRFHQCLFVLMLCNVPKKQLYYYGNDTCMRSPGNKHTLIGVNEEDLHLFICAILSKYWVTARR